MSEPEEVVADLELEQENREAEYGELGFSYPLAVDHWFRWRM